MRSRYHTPSPQDSGIISEEGAEESYNSEEGGRLHGKKCFLGMMMMHIVSHRSCDERTDPHKIKTDGISAWVSGELKSDPLLRSYWKLMVARKGLVFFGIVVSERLPLLYTTYT